jgi:glycine hydroxymethyltransferase
MSKSDLRRFVDQLRTGAEAAEYSINLVPSENRLSPLARLPLATDFVNRYFFNEGYDPGFWQFRGGQSVASLETDLAVPSLSRLSDSLHVNVRPISGMSAMMIALAGLAGNAGETVVSINAECGGHYATADVIRRLGFVSVTVPVHQGVVDERCLREVLCARRPKLIYLDSQNSRHELQLVSVVEAVKAHSPDTIVHVDCSHTLGLVLGGALTNPLDLGASSIGGSTHKSFPGPHKGVLITRDAELHERMRDAQFRSLSSHHFAQTLALGFAAAEFECFGDSYAKQVIANAKYFADRLTEAGFDVVRDEDGFATGTHQVWVRLGSAAVTDTFSAALYEQGIRVNIQTDLPGVPGPVLRLGVSELTFIGARDEAVEALTREFAAARAGVAKDGKGARRIRDAVGSPFYFTDLDGP